MINISSLLWIFWLHFFLLSHLTLSHLNTVNLIFCFPTQEFNFPPILQPCQCQWSPPSLKLPRWSTGLDNIVILHTHFGPCSLKFLYHLYTPCSFLSLFVYSTQQVPYAYLSMRCLEILLIHPLHFGFMDFSNHFLSISKCYWLTHTMSSV